MSKKDKLTNFYNVIGDKYKTKIKRDKNFKDHMIEPESMILCIGGTGTGKTNALVNFLKRKKDYYNVSNKRSFELWV